MRRLFLLFLVLFASLAQAGSNPFESKPDFLPVGKAFVLTSERLESGETQLFWQIANGYYLYQKRLTFNGLADAHKPARRYTPVCGILRSVFSTSAMA